MNRAQNHKIHTASLQVQFEGMEGVLGMQDNLGLLFYEKIEPLLQKAFDRSADPRATIVLDKLILDCGKLSGENWEEEMLLAIPKLLEEKLQSVRMYPRYEKTIEQQAEEVMVFFLEKGYFPWNSPFSAPIELERGFDMTTSQALKLAAFLRSSSVFRMRFHRGFSLAFRRDFLNRLSDNPPPEIRDFLDFAAQKAHVDRSFFEAVFEVIVSVPMVSSTAGLRFFQRIIEVQPESQLPILAEFFSVHWMENPDRIWEFFNFNGQETRVGFLERVGQLVQKVVALQPVLAEDLDKAFSNFEKQKMNQSPDTGSNASTADKLPASKEDPSSSPNTTHTPVMPEKDGPHEGVLEDIYISNAGLVLLHPFIPALFDTLELQKEGHFISPDAQMAAAKVLQFLVWGDNTLSENHFPLIKVLLGIPLHQVLELEIELPEAWKMECEAMISEVIQHWAVLKNTSNAGLRETFLQRQGKISPVASGWKLQIERKTVDVLLGKLPWGIGIIKLPWMNEIMYVDWN